MMDKEQNQKTENNLSEENENNEAFLKKDVRAVSIQRVQPWEKGTRTNVILLPENWTDCS